jgi:hypothetical protein
MMEAIGAHLVLDGAVGLDCDGRASVTYPLSRIVGESRYSPTWFGAGATGLAASSRPVRMRDGPNGRPPGPSVELQERCASDDPTEGLGEMARCARDSIAMRIAIASFV